MRRLLILLVDLSLVALGTVLALWLRDDLLLTTERLRLAGPYLGLTLAAAVLVLPIFGVNRGIWRYSELQSYLRIALSSFVIVICAVAVTFGYNRLDGVPRSLPILQVLVVITLLVGSRVLRRLQQSMRASRPAGAQMPLLNGGAETVLVVGLTRLADLYLRSVVEFAPKRIRVAGLLGRKDHHIGAHVHNYSILGLPENAADIVRSLEVHGVVVDRIVVATDFKLLSAVAQQALLQLEASTSVKLELLFEQLGLEEPQMPTSYSSTFHFSDAEIEKIERRPYWKLKRAIDFVAAAVVIFLTLPIMVLVALLVAIDVGSPVLFAQQRPGRYGMPFRVYKFRTMAAAHDRQGHRVPDTKRTSIIGSFLRRTRCDELPQLFSILTGDMSFVGPRPLLPVDQPPEFAARLLVPPGLTGWAQVNGGRDVIAADKAALDVWYVQNASLVLDLKIVLRTAPMVILGERLSEGQIERAWSDLYNSGICTGNSERLPTQFRRVQNNAVLSCASVPDRRLA